MAVDPGPMDEKLIKTGLVVHRKFFSLPTIYENLCGLSWTFCHAFLRESCFLFDLVKNKIEDCKLPLQNHGLFDIIVSDMNIFASECIKIFQNFKDFLKPTKKSPSKKYCSGMIIFTLKLQDRAKQKREKLLEFCRSFLKNEFEILDIVWLFANTSQERTLICRVL